MIVEGMLSFYLSILRILLLSCYLMDIHNDELENYAAIVRLRMIIKNLTFNVC